MACCPHVALIGRLAHGMVLLRLFAARAGHARRPPRPNSCYYPEQTLVAECETPAYASRPGQGRELGAGKGAKRTLSGDHPGELLPLLEVETVENPTVRALDLQLIDRYAGLPS